MKVLQQVKWEQKQFWRNPPAAVFTFVFPLMFLLIFSSLYSSDRIAQLGNIKFVQQYVPAIVAFIADLTSASEGDFLAKSRKRSIRGNSDNASSAAVLANVETSARNFWLSSYTLAKSALIKALCC